MILGNKALTQSNDVAKNTNSHPTVTVAPGCPPWILDQIGKDEIFQGHLLRLVLEVWKVKHFGVFGGQTFLTLFHPQVLFFPLTADLSGVTTWLAKAKQALFKPEEIMLDQLIWRMAGSGIMPGYHVQSLKAHLTTGFLISCWLIWRTQRRRTLQNSIDSLFPIDTHGTMHAIFTEQFSISHKKAVLVVAVSLTSLQDNEVSRFDKWTKSLFQDVKMVRHLLAYTRSCAAMIWGSLHTAD